MSMEHLVIPQGYAPKMSLIDTEIAIKLIKDTFEQELASRLDLIRVSAPLFVRPQSGLNDDLSGVERPVQFDILDLQDDVQIIHSLAKWKRMVLSRYGFPCGQGIYTDMNAIRRDEDLDNLHSVYVDQWDWEKVIAPEERTIDLLKQTVRAILKALLATQKRLCVQFAQMDAFIPESIHFVTSQELEDAYPELTPKQREDAVTKRYGAVFLMQIGGELSSGKPHDSRAPDYDDWSLNGDILVWYPVLGRAVELSSMGIRVDAPTLRAQLQTAGCTQREKLEFHHKLLNGELPLTIGGGIGQSRICMILLGKAHIGEVQASAWPQEMIDTCLENSIHLL